MSIEGAERIIVRSIEAWCLNPMLHTSNMHCVIQLERKHGVIYIINGPRLFLKFVLTYFVCFPVVNNGVNNGVKSLGLKTHQDFCL